MRKFGIAVWAGAVLMTAPLAAQTLTEWASLGSAGDVAPLHPVKYHPLPDAEETEEPATFAETPINFQAGGGCVDAACDEGVAEGCGCESCGCQTCCCEDPYFMHRSSVWGGFLFLHANDSDVPYAYQASGTGGLGTVPDGRVATVAPNYEPAFIIGGSKALSCVSSVWFSYTHFESNATDQVDSPPVLDGLVKSLMLHPGTDNVGAVANFINANYDIDFDLVDVQYSHLLASSNHHYINYNAGVRYATLDQYFRQFGTFAAPLGDMSVTDTIDFSGVGPRFGFDGRSRLGRTGFSGYGNAFLSLLVGEFNSQYTQINETQATQLAYSSWDDHRIVPLLETELGVAWQNCSGCFRISCGYQLNWWFNMVTTANHVKAVQDTNAETGIQQNGFVNVRDTMAFDGLTSRVEWRF